jgi:hypothetical protein
MNSSDKIMADRAEERIITTHIYPPIAVRRFDWCAYRESYEPPDSDGVGGYGHRGFGATEQEAINDLIELESE